MVAQTTRFQIARISEVHSHILCWILHLAQHLECSLQRADGILSSSRMMAQSHQHIPLRNPFSGSHIFPHRFHLNNLNNLNSTHRISRFSACRLHELFLHFYPSISIKHLSPEKSRSHCADAEIPALEREGIQNSSGILFSSESSPPFSLRLFRKL